MLTADVVYMVYLFYNAILWVSSFIEYISLSVYWKWSLKASFCRLTVELLQK